MSVRRIGLVLFSALFWVCALFFMAVLAMATFLALLFVHYRHVHWKIPAPGFRWIIRFATLGKYRVIYDPRFDPSRSSVFTMNHTNLLDAHAASGAIPQPFGGLMNDWQKWIPFYGWLMSLSRGIFVRRGDGNVLRQITEAARARKEEGMSILTFPEAHRTLDGKIRPFRKGIFFMARDAGFPVVPVAARGMFDLNRKGSFLFTPSPVEVYIGPQFETGGLSASGVETLADDVRNFTSDFVERGILPQLTKAANE